MGEEKELPGLRDQKDLLDQSCVCVMRFQREAGFVSFVPFQLWALSLAESHTLPLLQSQSSI